MLVTFAEVFRRAGMPLPPLGQSIEEEIRFRSEILDAVAQAVIATDLDGRVSSLNDVAESLTGWTAKEALGQPLEAVFRMSESQAYRVMMTAHQRGACVIAVYTRDVAETKAKEATELGKSKGYPLFFTTEPEE